MALRNTDRQWGAVAKCLHWSIAFLIFAQIALGWMAVTWRLSPTKLELYIWHKSLGILLLVMVGLRLLWRFVGPTPLPPAGTARFEHMAANAGHTLLYVLMIALPITGWIINSAANIPFRVFWWFPLPAITAPDKSLEAIAKQAHFALFVVLATVVVVHIAAALRHHFVKRNNVLVRMLPGKGTRT